MSVDKSRVVQNGQSRELGIIGKKCLLDFFLTKGNVTSFVSELIWSFKI
jgi:hypothetical protein